MISDGNHTYAYDAENRLISVDGGQTATYMYSADGLRVRSTVGSDFSDFIHDADGETVGVLGTNGALIRQEIGGLATYTANGAFFHHRDWLGNLRAVTDQNGTVQSTCTNLPYGDALNCTSTGVTPLDFTGYMRDSESNLDFANARYYSSQFGRFMSPDPLGGTVSDPQSLNRYAYVLNSPLSMVDPSGMDGCTVLDGVANCVVSTGGLGGDGGGGPFGGSGTFGGGFGGDGNLAICGSLDCGFGGGSGLPGPPSASQLAAEQSFSQRLQPGSFLKGLGLGLTVNAFVDFTVLVEKMSAGPYRPRTLYLERYRIEPKNFSELAGGFVSGFVAFGIPEFGEEELAAGMAGRFGDLNGLRVTGDLLTPHHMPQAALRFTSRADGGAIMLTQAEHEATRTFGIAGVMTKASDAGLPFRKVLALDIRDVRGIAGSKYNKGLFDLLEYYRKNFPSLMKK